MTTTQPTKNPYTFSKDAWHCRLFKWIRLFTRLL